MQRRLRCEPAVTQHLPREEAETAVHRAEEGRRGAAVLPRSSRKGPMIMRPRTLAWLAVCGGLLAPLIGRSAPAPQGASPMPSPPPPRVVTLSALCLLDGAAHANRDYVLQETRQACVRGKPDLVVTPFLPFLSFQEGHEREELGPFAALAREHRTYLAVAMVERRKDGRRSHTAVLLARDGQVAGRYRQAHALPDEDELALGDDLPVFKTDFARIGLSLASDLFFPEVAWVQRMKGAEILLWQTAPPRFRQHHDWPALLKARCMDAHAPMVTAMYADPRTYVTNRYEVGMQGAAWGRSMVLNRVGVPVADTGYEDGIATAIMDLAKRKQEAWSPWYQRENVFYPNNMGDRTAFRPLAEPYRAPERPSYRRRAARIAVGGLWSRGVWSNQGVPEGMLRVIDEAAALKPDLLLMTEMAAKVNGASYAEVAALVAERARRMNAYIVIGGLGDDQHLSIAHVWDREGREIFQEPIYWTKGFPDLAVLDTDFARIGIQTCGDLYTGEIARTLALKGAELILDPSQYWGGGGETDDPIQGARAADNGCWIACAHWNTSDAALRSIIVDPYGKIVAATHFQREHVVATDIDFADTKVYYAGRRAEQSKPGDNGVNAYLTADLPEQRPGWRDMLFARRRPELYTILPSVNDVLMQYRPLKAPWD